MLNYKSCLETFLKESEFDMSFSDNWNRRHVHPDCVSHFENTGTGAHFRNSAPVLNMPAATEPEGFFPLR